MKIPHFPVLKLPLIGVSTDPLDLLLVALTLRMKQLARLSPEFVEMVYNKKFRIEIGVIEGMARQIIVDHGKISSEPAGDEKADLKLKFKDSEYAVKTLLKGDPTAFMTGMQAGNIKIEGDFSLLMWFNQAAKLLQPNIPKPIRIRIRQLGGLLSQKSASNKDQQSDSSKKISTSL